MESDVYLPRISESQTARVKLNHAADVEPDVLIGIVRGSLSYNSQVMTACEAQINAAIEVSSRMLEWPEDWDGEGARAYSRATFDRAVAFIRETSSEFLRTSGKTLPAPRILPGPDGSIDIDWRNGQRELLINIPADEEESPDFYGDNGPTRNVTIKGTFRLTSSQSWLLTWLTN